MPTFDYVPAPGSAEQTQPRVRRARFGDGYEQRVADGINALVRRWTLQFNRATTDVDAIIDFLEARAGVETFDWTPPRGAAGVWICRDYSVTMHDAAAQTVSAVFEEMFE